MKLQRLLIAAFAAVSIAVSVVATDCVPSCFQTLSDIYDRRVDYRIWANALLRENHSPELDVALSYWSKYVRGTQLVCVFSVYDRRVSEPDWAVVDGTPLLWIGRLTEGLAADQNADPTEMHAAILVFNGEKIYLIHTISGGTVFLEPIGIDRFMAQTVEIYRVSSTHQSRLKTVTVATLDEKDSCRIGPPQKQPQFKIPEIPFGIKSQWRP